MSYVKLDSRGRIGNFRKNHVSKLGDSTIRLRISYHVNISFDASDFNSLLSRRSEISGRQNGKK